MPATLWIALGWTMFLVGIVAALAALFGVARKAGGSAGFGGAVLIWGVGVLILSAHKALPDGDTFVTIFAITCIAMAILRLSMWFSRHHRRKPARPVVAPPPLSTVAAATPAVREMKPHPFDILLHYRDGNGDTTERRVTVQRILGVEGGDGTLRIDKIGGWCHLRRGERTFVLSRIEEMAEAETGEIVDPASFLLAKAGHAAHG